MHFMFAVNVRHNYGLVPEVQTELYDMFICESDLEMHFQNVAFTFTSKLAAQKPPIFSCHYNNVTT